MTDGVVPARHRVPIGAVRFRRAFPSAVHGDGGVPAEYGLVTFQRDGQSKQPFVPYETIGFDVTIRALLTGGDTEAPA